MLLVTVLFITKFHKLNMRLIDLSYTKLSVWQIQCSHQRMSTKDLLSTSDLDEDLNSGKQSLDDILQNDRIDHSRDDTFFHPFLWDGLDSGAKEGSLDFRGAFKYSKKNKKYNPDGVSFST